MRWRRSGSGVKKPPRAFFRALIPERSCAKRSFRIRQIDAYAATTGPGLAAALSCWWLLRPRDWRLAQDVACLAVNHLEGHLLSPFFGERQIPAHVSLIVSGGHTLLFDVEGYGRYRLLGRTLDDAAGEAFDKDREDPGTKDCIQAARKWTGSRERETPEDLIFLAV